MDVPLCNNRKNWDHEGLDFVYKGLYGDIRVYDGGYTGIMEKGHRNYNFGLRV